MDVVIDKSYLRGASVEAVRLLGNKNNLLMPEVLFMELMTTAPEDRRMCFKKFPTIENPVALIPGVGNLMRYEIENKIASTPIIERRLKFDFVFNEEVTQESWRFTKDQVQANNDWDYESRKYTRGFIEQCQAIPIWFPKLANDMQKVEKSSMDAIMNRLSTDSDFILEIYDQTRPSSFPKTELIDENWIIFRRWQAHLLYGVDYIDRYRTSHLEQISKALINQRLDIEYVVTAILAGALATNEDKKRTKSMATFFKMLLPEGHLFAY